MALINPIDTSQYMQCVRQGKKELLNEISDLEWHGAKPLDLQYQYDRLKRYNQLLEEGIEYEYKF